jgi:protein MpaA
VGQGGGLAGRRCVLAAALAAVLAAACSSGGGDGGGGASATTATTISATTSSATTTGVTTTSRAATPATTEPSTTPVPPSSTTTALPPGVLDRVELGRSVEGRPITALRRGTPGGRVVLVIGVIHGDEDAGVAVIERLVRLPVPEGVDLWLIESINPDGQAAGRRTNANLVDLNRNFPRRWAPLGQPGEWQYAGTGPASEPETAATVAFVSTIRPDLTIWYHQDLFRINPAQGRAGRLRRQYAELTGLPVLPVTGGVYTGTAAPWVQEAVAGSVAFVVELGPTLSAAEADTHAAAVLTIAR